MQYLTLVIHFVYLMTQNIIGVIFWPYTTYFKLTHEKTPSMGITFLLLVPFYTVIAIVVKNGLFHTNAILLLTTFLRHTFAIWSTFLLSFLGLLILAELLKRQRRNLIIFTLWAFSYVPTYVWFIVTALLYFLLPPPRTPSLLGQSFSVAFISFTLLIFLWKLLLYYLTLRIGLKMTLPETVLASVFLFPLFGIFSFVSYKFGIFRVPFV